MKKIKNQVAFLLVFILIFSLAGCGNPKKEDSHKSQDGSGKTKDQKKTSDNIDVDEGVVMVDVTLPAAYFEGESEEEIRKGAKKNKFSKCVINKDGSVTFTMTKAKRREILREMEKTFNEVADEVIAGNEEKASPFTEITHNKDFSEIKMTVDDSYNDLDILSSLGCMMIGYQYQAIKGIPEEDINVLVKIIDEETGEEISSVSSREFLESENAGESKQ